MNKEVEELIEQLEEYASGGGSGLYPFEESVKALLDYINQLETNRDKAIEYLKENEDKPIYLDCKFYETKEYKDLLEILRGDK